MTTIDRPSDHDGRAPADRSPGTPARRNGRRRRPHAAAASRVLVAGASASATLLLVAGFASADRRAEPAPTTGDPALATRTTVPAVTGWDGGGATAATSDASPADYYSGPDTTSEAS